MSASEGNGGQMKEEEEGDFAAGTDLLSLARPFGRPTARMMNIQVILPTRRGRRRRRLPSLGKSKKYK